MIKHLSYTSLDRLTRCPKSFEFAYIDRIRVPVKGELVRGDAYHKALAYAYTSIVVYKERPSKKEVLQVYSDTWDKRLLDKIVIDEGEEISIPSVDFRDKDPGKMKDEGVKLVEIYYDTILPKIIPHEVEVWKERVYSDGGIDVPLLAKIDLIEWSGAVDDHKVKAKMFSDGELAKDFQSTFYGLVLGVNELEFNFHAAIAVKEPHIEIIPIKRTGDEIDWVGKMVIAAWRLIWSGIFTPCTQGWWCAADQCAYWNFCRLPSWF